MNPTGKKFISLLLIFSFLMINCISFRTTSSKERRGAELIIQRKSDPPEITRLKGTPWEKSVITGIRGELIAVKQNSILLLDTEGKDVSVDIKEIKYIKVKISKKTRRACGAIIGILTLGSIIVILGVAPGKEQGELTWQNSILVMALLGPIVAQLGAIIGAAGERYKTIQIEGMTDSEIQETLDYLRKRARIRNYK